MDESGSKVFSFWLPPELIEGLDKIAAASLRTRNKVVRDTLTTLVESGEPVQNELPWR